MAQPDADRPPSDRGIAARVVELREIFAQAAKQRAHAQRQRDAARSMREEAGEMRTRSSRDWPRAP